MPITIKPNLADKINVNKCMFPSCNLVQEIRGLCKKHYQSARVLVVNEQTTWDELVARGKCREATYHQDSPVRDWFLNE